MYAIIEAGGQQFKVSPGDTVKIQKTAHEPGKISIEKVLLVAKDDDIRVGKPFVENTKVEAEIVGSGKDDKVLVYKQRPRKGYRKLNGHRQGYTVLKVNDIVFGG